MTTDQINKKSSLYTPWITLGAYWFSGATRIGDSYVLVCSSGEVHRYVSGNWVKTDFGTQAIIKSIDCSKDGKIIVCTDGINIFHSPDAGVSWVKTNPGLTGIKKISLGVDNTTIMVMTSDAIYSGKYQESFEKLADYAATGVAVNSAYSIACATGQKFWVSNATSLKYSGYIYSTGVSPDTTHIIRRPCNGSVSSSVINSSQIIPLGEYFVFPDTNVSYLGDITDVVSMKRFGVFFDNDSGRLIKASVLDNIPSITSFFDTPVGITLAVETDLIWSSEFIAQFGARFAMANVVELNGVDNCVNGNFLTGTGTGWSGVFTIIAGGRATSQGATLAAGGSISQTPTNTMSKVIFYAKGDISGFTDCAIDADLVNVGWFRVIQPGYSYGKISIVNTGERSVTISDVYCLEAVRHSSSIYISDILDYQDFVSNEGSGDIVEFPANSRDITGIMPSGQTLYVIKNDVTGTISETGDHSNPFSSNQGSIAKGGKYACTVDTMFAVMKEENGKAIILLFTGQDYVKLNEFWDSPYSIQKQSLPTFEVAPIYSAMFGDKTIIFQNSVASGPWGVVISGGIKSGTVQIGRIERGAYFGEVVSKIPSFGRIRVEGDFDNIRVKTGNELTVGSTYSFDILKSTDGGLNYFVMATKTYTGPYVYANEMVFSPGGHI
jgi:hypothetical protein